MDGSRKPNQGCQFRLLVVVLLAAVGCLATTLLLLNVSPRLAFALLGLKESGFLAEALPAEPRPLVLNGERLDQIAFVLPPQLRQPSLLAAVDGGDREPPFAALIGDSSAPGVTKYLVTLDEEAFNRLLREQGLIQSEDSHRYRDVIIDLQPGGLIVHADVQLGLRWERMGVLLLLDEASLTLSPVGLVHEGSVYALAESGPITGWLVPVGRPMEDTLRSLQIVGPLPGDAGVNTVRFARGSVQIQAEGAYAISSQQDTGWMTVEPGLELREIDIVESAEQPTQRLSIVRIQPDLFHVRVHYEPLKARAVSAWGAALNSLLVVNGGYFAPEDERGYETVGMLISDGQRFGTPFSDHAGMVAVTGEGQVTVRWLRQQPYEAYEPLTQAVQSFPMLVRPGGIMAFPSDADDGSVARRTVVAQDRGGNILFVVTQRGAMSLHKLATWLAESDLSIDVALNLDGGGSTGMWLAVEQGATHIDSLTPIPSVISVDKLPDTATGQGSAAE